uniref:Uncharacterized protein n=1 Tax=Oryza nivara TaxID=4536 RepID=A0A0E0I8A0_ORYNI
MPDAGLCELGWKATDSPPPSQNLGLEDLAVPVARASGGDTNRRRGGTATRRRGVAGGGAKGRCVRRGMSPGLRVDMKGRRGGDNRPTQGRRTRGRPSSGLRTGACWRQAGAKAAGF